tara:strand:+ start:7908 stop:8297 length:390 start_codon:yes stop_codon:yes gene_type:complete
MKCKNLKKQSRSPLSAFLLFCFLPIWLLISVPLVMSMKLLHRLFLLLLRKTQKRREPISFIRSPNISKASKSEDYFFYEETPEEEEESLKIWMALFDDPYVKASLVNHLENCFTSTKTITYNEFDDPLY